jgi:hypothetical protein
MEEVRVLSMVFLGNSVEIVAVGYRLSHSVRLTNPIYQSVSNLMESSWFFFGIAKPQLEY